MTQIALQEADLVQTGPVDGVRERIDGLARRASRPVQSLRAVPHLGTWVGVLLATAGVVLLVVAWGQTAGETNVALQIPYVISAGFTGLGLVAVGLTVVSVAAKRADASERTRQLGELRSLLAELREAVEDDAAPRRTGPDGR